MSDIKQLALAITQHLSDIEKRTGKHIEFSTTSAAFGMIMTTATKDVPTEAQEKMLASFCVTYAKCNGLNLANIADNFGEVAMALDNISKMLESKPAFLAPPPSGKQYLS